jgi:hypothetical protein
MVGRSSFIFSVPYIIDFDVAAAAFAVALSLILRIVTKGLSLLSQSFLHWMIRKDLQKWNGSCLILHLREQLHFCVVSFSGEWIRYLSHFAKLLFALGLGGLVTWFSSTERSVFQYKSYQIMSLIWSVKT